ncbi:MAG: hypothetical protein ACOC80_10320 [Petrotogales bacterium]
MKRIRPYFKLNKKNKQLEVWGQPNRNMMRFPTTYSLTDEDIPIVEKLLQRDFKTAILFKNSSNDGISQLCWDILEQKG